MLQHLQDKLLRQVLGFLMVPTTLCFILNPDEPPSIGMVDCLRSRVQEVRRFLAPPAEVVPTIRGLVALLDEQSVCSQFACAAAVPGFGS